MKDCKENEGTVDIFEMLKGLWEYKWIIIVFVVVASLFTVVKKQYFTADTYTAGGIIYAKSGNYSTQNQTDAVDIYNEISTARVLTSTYIETLKMRSFLMEVSHDLDNKYSWGQIGGMMSISQVGETEMLAISVRAPSAQDAYDVAKSILKLAPYKLSDVTEGGTIKVVDNVIKPSSPDGKGVVSSVIFSALVSAALAAVLIYILKVFDNKVRKSEDVEKRYNVSILGIIELD